MAELNVKIHNYTDYEIPELLNMACIIARDSFLKLEEKAKNEQSYDEFVRFYNIRTTYDNLISAIERGVTE